MAKKAKATSTKRATSSSPASGAKGKLSPVAKQAATSTKASAKAAPFAKTSSTKSMKAGVKTTAGKSASPKAAAQAVPKALGKKAEKKPTPKVVEAAPKKVEKKKSKEAVADQQLEARLESQEPTSMVGTKSNKLAKPAEQASVEASEGGADSEKSPEKKKKRDELKIDRAGDLVAQWQALYDRAKAVKPVAYKMSENYEARTPLLHKVLGWGYVLVSQNNRLEVLFKDGIKILIANYKGG